MTRPCKWILMPAILTISLTAGIGREASAAEGIFEGERFRVSEGLVPDFQDAVLTYLQVNDFWFGIEVRITT